MLWLFTEFIMRGIWCLGALGFVFLAVTHYQLNNPHTQIDLERLVKSCPTCHWSGDVIATATQIGRLDMVSIALTVLGSLIGVFAFVGFWLVRSEVLDQAKKAAEEATKKEVKVLTAQELEKYLDGDGGSEKLKAIVAKRISDIMKTEDIIMTFAEAVAPKLQASEEVKKEITKELQLDSIPDDEVTDLTQEVSRDKPDRDHENG